MKRQGVSSHPVFRWAAFACASGILALAGCNLFSPMAADDQKDLTYRGLVLKGSQAINAGDWASAERYFASAKRLNHRGSEAYLFHSKALMSLYGLDYNSMNKEFEDHNGKDTSSSNRGVPFVDSLTTLAGIDSVYYPVATSVENLEHIIRGRKDTVALDGRWKMFPDGDTASDGRITEGVARLDLGLLQAVKAMLAPLDLDGNLRIDSLCGANFCPAFSAGCMASEPYRSKCKEGKPSEKNRFENFKKLTKNIALGSLDSKDVRARNVSVNPNDINGFLDAMQAPIAGSNFNLDSVTGSMTSHGEGEMSKQLDNITGNIKDLNSFLGYMRYDDTLDNDFDKQLKSAPRPGMMVWHDYDREGGIRWNYDSLPTRDGWPEVGGHNLGNPLHRYLNKDMYVTMAQYKLDYPALGADTSKNSRIALIIKKCRDVASTFPVNPRMTELLRLEILNKVCSTYTPFVKPDVKPPARSDWISGTYGVDEEMVDERDNDQDGLKDEDARNAIGMDDDDDAMLDTTWIGRTIQPMAWADAATHDNDCPDIDRTTPMQAFPMQREFCVGSLEHRIHLAKQPSGRDSLERTYSQFGGEFPNQNCLDDFDKLPAEYKARANVLTTSDPAVRLACIFKHIWFGPPPPNSEWTSGIFGVDEEIPDGVDNDGDGWIDEDMK